MCDVKLRRVYLAHLALRNPETEVLLMAVVYIAEKKPLNELGSAAG